MRSSRGTGSPFLGAAGAGRPTTSLCLSLPGSFTGQVLWTLLTAVGFGEVVSYRQLAALAGSPRAARAVGGAMRSNPVSPGRQGGGVRAGPGTARGPWHRCERVSPAACAWRTDGKRL